MKTSKANAVWQGKLKDGKGTATIPSIGQEVKYTFSTRFENDRGTNPEELIAAAHSQCFSMAFSQLLTESGYNPVKIATSAEVTIGEKGEGMAILRSRLICDAEVPEIEDDEFQKLAEEAKKNCPVSQALASVDISLDANLVH